jgi:hypothetical protein
VPKDIIAAGEEVKLENNDKVSYEVTKVRRERRRGNVSRSSWSAVPAWVCEKRPSLASMSRILWVWVFHCFE